MGVFFWVAEEESESGDREVEKDGKREGELKGVNRNVFDPGRQMLKRSCLFCVKAHLSWQVAVPRWLFVPNPALMSR